MQLLPSGYYKHYKGTVYHVFCTCQHNETGEHMVVYGRNGPEWVRPLDNFIEMVEVNGQMVDRFRKVEAIT